MEKDSWEIRIWRTRKPRAQNSERVRMKKEKKMERSKCSGNGDGTTGRLCRETGEENDLKKRKR